MLDQQRYQTFLAHQGLTISDLQPLAGDASARRYFRIQGSSKMLMDMPPAVLDIKSYLRVAEHLHRLGLRVPAVYAAEETKGLALIEDLGNNTFTQLLSQGESEQTLYNLAIDQLIYLHQQPSVINIEAPHYDEALLLREAARLSNWFYPCYSGERLASSAHKEYLDSWRSILRAMPEPVISLVLVDFHVDNLLRLTDGRCAILDFQDARIGPTAYDVMSLLEDARRDVDSKVASAAKARYLASRPKTERDAFEQWYVVLAAQRHCKVLGLFLRLCIQADKCQYLVHLPRVARLLEHHLQAQTRLKPLRDWLDHYLPQRLQPLPELDRSKLQRLLMGTD